MSVDLLPFAPHPCEDCGVELAAWEPFKCERCDRERANARRRRGPAPDRACDSCGEVFTPQRRSARFCSSRCRLRAHRAALAR